MTIIDAFDKLERAGYAIGEDAKGIYLVADSGGKPPPIHCPLLIEAINSMVLNKKAVTYYYSGIYP